jgi:hypothetical protein
MGLLMRPVWGHLLASIVGFCVAAPCAAAEESVRLPGGTRFALELAQHITSGRTPAGSPVFFRVSEDVTAGGHTLIRQGTLVEGRMQAIGDRGMAATSGSINFGVRYVTAVDGQNIRVLATVSNKGRSRDGALLGWVFMWGIFGLTTKGVDAYALRGAPLEAEVLTDRDVRVTPPATSNAPDSPPTPISITGARLGQTKVKEVVISLERANERRPLSFDLPAAAPLGSASLIAVNGRAVPVPVAATSTSSDRLEFDVWDIVKFCDEGDNVLRFRLQQADGASLDASYGLVVKLKRKQ